MGNQEQESVTDTSSLENLPENLSVEEIAKQITVRILGDEGSGSGVIIARHGSIYTVLTNAHVVDRGNDNQYTVLTADGMTHLGQWQQSNRFGNLDLALVEFDSNKSYHVAVLGDSKALSIDELVYSAGFPNYYFPKNANYVESTYSWGLRAFVLTTGQVGMLSEKSLPRGYSLGYTNDVADGMSGGPVLNQKGELVGINGRSKYALSGINAYTFTDGTRPSYEFFEQMDALSWAIPIAKFNEIKTKSP
ncbi:MAG: trypsin-like peptidase domain-containing protein [Symploca sp. SIO3E6]|nr:trypsin-like peptidase domain-containing protein [Caldora sp. SIO3E6]